MNEKDVVAQLESEGYKPVYVYEAAPEEIDEEHTHDFDTKLVILRGDIRITRGSHGVLVDERFTEGQETIIPRTVRHAARVGADGCRYIVAERHSS